MAEPDQVPTTSDLQRQINDIGKRMDEGFRDIKDILRDSQSRLQILELKEAASGPAVSAKLDGLQKDIDCQTRRGDELEKTSNEHAQSITKLQEQNRLLLWLAMVEGAGLLTWIIPNVLNLIGK